MDITKNKWAADTGNKRENKRFFVSFSGPLKSSLLAKK